MGRKTTDEEIRKMVEHIRKILMAENGGGTIGNGHIDFRDCAVWFDDKGYTVVDRYGRDRAEVRRTY